MELDEEKNEEKRGAELNGAPRVDGCCFWFVQIGNADTQTNNQPTMNTVNGLGIRRCPDNEPRLVSRGWLAFGTRTDPNPVGCTELGRGQSPLTPAPPGLGLAFSPPSPTWALV